MTTFEYYAIAALAGILGFGGLIAAIIVLAEKRGEDKNAREQFEKQIKANNNQAQSIADRPRDDDDVLKRLSDDAKRAND